MFHRFHSRLIAVALAGIVVGVSAAPASAEVFADYHGRHSDVRVGYPPYRPDYRYGPPRYAPYPYYPPVRRGVFISVLPPAYTTVYFGGLPYYYSNNVYYSWSADRNAYEVVTPPAAAAPASSPAASTTDLYTYPKAGQSPEKQAQDRFECHSWANGQSGFDPTQANGGVPASQADARRADYLRAMTACLQARNYAVT
jgi:hypothetical protein